MGVFDDAVKPPTIRAGYGTRDTIRRLQRKSISRSKARQVAQTMYYRAKYHKYQTPGMRDAMKVYKEFLAQLPNK